LPLCSYSLPLPLDWKATLCRCSYESYDDPAPREWLWRQALARGGPAGLGVYLAHLMLRQVDWSIRFYGPEVVDHWVRVSQEVLRRLP